MVKYYAKKILQYCIVLLVAITLNFLLPRIMPGDPVKYMVGEDYVYMTVEERDGEVQIIFRNMSRYALDISAEELKERFVRGDRSRHLEGNGLGLSITESLVELQNGHMDIVIDGDLFKVVLEFQEICCGSGEHLL